MTAKPRDLLKNRGRRVGEVLSNIGLNTGQANSQLVASGCVITKGGTSNRQVLVSAGVITLAQAIVDTAAVAATSLPGGASTDASTYRKVLLELNASGALSFKVGTGAAAQADAPFPKGDTDKVSIGYIELPASFTVDTTSLTDGMIKQMPYFAA